MKKTLILGLLACLLFDTQGMKKTKHHKLKKTTSQNMVSAKKSSSSSLISDPREENPNTRLLRSPGNSNNKRFSGKVWRSDEFESGEHLDKVTINYKSFQDADKAIENENDYSISAWDGITLHDLEIADIVRAADTQVDISFFNTLDYGSYKYYVTSKMAPESYKFGMQQYTDQ